MASYCSSSNAGSTELSAACCSAKLSTNVTLVWPSMKKKIINLLLHSILLFPRRFPLSLLPAPLPISLMISASVHPISLRPFFQIAIRIILKAMAAVDVGDDPGPRVPYDCTYLCRDCIFSLYCCSNLSYALKSQNNVPVGKVCYYTEN
jgi:hypothetical protein